MESYYDILGVSKEASDADIKKAYRSLAQKYHPDKNAGDPKAADQFKKLQEAYEVLSDAQKRAQYDQFGRVGGNGGNPFNGAGFNFEDFGGFADIFENFFGGAGGQGGGRPQKRRPGRGGDIEAEMEIRFEEAVFGTTKYLEITKPETCTHCDAKGYEPGSKILSCDECGGKGQVRTVRQTILGQISSVQVCAKCHGQGETPEKVCGTCQGKTRVQKTSEVKISIPKGIEDGTRIKLAGQGSAGVLGGPHGDLYIVVNVLDHPKFKRDGRTIYSFEDIPLLTMVLGGKVTIDTLHGKEELRIPAGTQHGTEFTLKSQGAPSLRNDQLGDHKVIVQVEIPTRLSSKEKELYTELSKEAGL